MPELQWNSPLPGTGKAGIAHSGSALQFVAASRSKRLRQIVKINLLCGRRSFVAVSLHFSLNTRLAAGLRVEVLAWGQAYVWLLAAVPKPWLVPGTRLAAGRRVEALAGARHTFGCWPTCRSPGWC